MLVIFTNDVWRSLFSWMLFTQVNMEKPDSYITGNFQSCLCVISL